MSGLGCVAFCVHVLGPVSSPLWVSDLSLRHAAGEGFLLGLRPDLGGVWLFLLLYGFQTCHFGMLRGRVVCWVCVRI